MSTHNESFGSNIIFDKDGIYNIGAAAANRPANIYAQTAMFAAGSAVLTIANFGASAFPLLAPAGSATAPSYSFSSATGGGLYLQDTNTVAISTNGSGAGVQRISVGRSSDQGGQISVWNASAAAISGTISGLDTRFWIVGQGQIALGTGTYASMNRVMDINPSDVTIRSGNVLLAPNGSATAPSYSFSTGGADSGKLGLYRPASGQLGIAAYDSNGGVGAPAVMFTSNFGVGRMYVANPNGTFTSFYGADSSNGRMQINASGPVIYFYVNGVYHSQFYNDGTTAALLVNKAFGTDPTDVALTADNQAIELGQTSYVRLTSNNATASNRTFTLNTASAEAGQFLVLEWNDATNAGELLNTGNVKLTADWTPSAKYQTLSLKYDGAFWIETGRTPSSGGGASFPLLAPNGSAAATSYSFSASVGTGMYSSATNTLDLAANGKSMIRTDGSNITLTPTDSAWSGQFIFGSNANAPYIETGGSGVRLNIHIPTSGQPFNIITGASVTALQVTATYVYSEAQAQWINGTAAAPSYSFNASNHVGMYSSGTNILDFSNNSVNTWRIDASGKLVSPANKQIGDYGGSLNPEFIFMKNTGSIQIGTDTAGTWGQSVASVASGNNYGIAFWAGSLFNAANHYTGLSINMQNTAGASILSVTAATFQLGAGYTGDVGQTVNAGNAIVQSSTSIAFDNTHGAACYYGYASGAGSFNTGMMSSAINAITSVGGMFAGLNDSTASHKSIGIAAYAWHTGASSSQIAGYFLLKDSSGNGNVAYFFPASGQVSAAIVADNGSSGADIANFFAAGTSKLRIDSTGNILASSDGSINIGTFSGNRPTQISAKSYITVGGNSSGQRTSVMQRNGGTMAMLGFWPDFGGADVFGFAYRDGGTTGLLELVGFSPNTTMFSWNTATGVYTMNGSSGANIVWSTDGGGQIGSSYTAGRPSDIYVKNSLSVGKAYNSATAVGGINAIVGASYSQILLTQASTVAYAGIQSTAANSLEIINDNASGNAVAKFLVDEFYMTRATGANIKWSTDAGGSIGATGGLNRPYEIYASHIVSAGDSYGNSISTGSATLLANGNSWLIFTFASQTGYSYIRSSAALLTEFGNTTTGITHQITSAGVFKMMLASGADLIWNTDGGGNIGNATHRPNHVYIASDLNFGDTAAKWINWTGTGGATGGFRFDSNGGNDTRYKLDSVPASGGATVFDILDNGSQKFRVFYNASQSFVQIDGHLKWNADNSRDIGTSDGGSSFTRPRNIYVGTSVLNADGSSSAPAYSFSNNTTIGMTNRGSNTLGFDIPTGGVFSFQKNGVDKLVWSTTFLNLYDMDCRIATAGYGVRNQDGTEAAPSYHWDAELTSGMWRNGANTVSFSTSSTEALRLTSNGDVVIMRANSSSQKLYLGPVANNISMYSDGTAMHLLAGTGGHYMNVNGHDSVFLSNSQFNLYDTHMVIQTAGFGLRVKEGSNAKQGVATLVAGTVTVSNTSVTSTSRIFLTVQSLGTVAVPQAVAVTARNAGTDFTITSTSALDTSVVAYEIFEIV